MSRDCEHPIVEPVPAERSQDTVTECCDCGKILGRAEPQDTLPSHWFRHRPHQGRGDFCLGQDFVDVEEPPLNIDATDEWIIQVCPACGGRLTAYHTGFSGMASDFKECVCGHCYATLFRNTTVILTQTAAEQNDDRFSTGHLQNYIKDRADKMFWRGEMASVSLQVMQGVDDPPTPLLGNVENINRVVEGGWEPRCPCCGESESYVDSVDFHHWDYENDVGCHLCRDCHSHIHRGMTASEQGELTDGWRRDAIRRLYERSTSMGLRFDVCPDFADRFNIPVDSETLTYIREVVEE